MISPGPDMVIVLRNTIIGGRVAGLQTSIGVLTGNLIHISYCIAGIGFVISQSILAFTLLKYAGAAYLIFLGIVSIRSARKPLDVSCASGARHAKTWFVQGFINNILNPKGSLFYLGVFTMVITPETSAAVTVGLILTMMMVSAVFWVFFIFTLDRAFVRGLIERSQHIVSRVFGALLVYLGIRVAVLER